MESENTRLLVIGESFCSVYAEESEVFTMSSGVIDETNKTISCFESSCIDLIVIVCARTIEIILDGSILIRVRVTIPWFGHRRDHTDFRFIIIIISVVIIFVFNSSR